MSGDALWKASKILGLVALMLAGILLGIELRRQKSPPPRLSVLFLDVGSGDCTLIRTPENHTVLIDAGSRTTGKVVTDTLSRLRVAHIDLLIMASPDSQSIGGVPEIVQKFPVSLVWDNSVSDMGTARRTALEAVRRRQISSRVAHAGDKIMLSNFPSENAPTRLTVLWPPEQGPRTRRDPLVLRLECGENSFLLAGAAASDSEPYWVANWGERLNSDVLQVAAGGTGAATSLELLRRATPELAIISCGRSAPPTPGTLHRLQAASAGVWRTDTQGSILVTDDGRTPPAVTANHL